MDDAQTTPSGPLILGKTLLVSIGVAGLTILVYQNQSLTPNPDPKPSIQVSASPSPLQALPIAVPGLQFSQEGGNKPLPSHDPALGDVAILRGSKGETLSALMKYSGVGCLTLPSILGPAHLQFFQPVPIHVTTSGLPNGPPGDFLDPLIPITEACQSGWVWVDVSIPPGSDPGDYTIPLPPMALHVWNLTLPPRPSRPLYMLVGAFSLLLGHKLDPNSSTAVEGPLTQKYVDLVRAHRVEPYGQYQVYPSPQADGTLNLDQFQGMGSYRELVLTNRLAEPMFPTNSVPNLPVYLPALQKTLVKEGLTKAWTYTWDEPGDAQIPQVASLALQTHSLAPAIKTMVTTQPNAALSGLVDHYVAVFEFWNAPGRVPASGYPATYWAYGACMSHACGGPPTLSGTPDLGSIEQPSVHALTFPLMSLAMGAEASLYYNTIEQYQHVPQGIDPWNSVYLFNSNGDGTLLYPARKGERGFTEEAPISSIRMKNVRDGMNLLEYLLLDDPKTALTLLPDTTHWTKDYTTYESHRLRIGNALGH